MAPYFTIPHITSRKFFKYNFSTIIHLIHENFDYLPRRATTYTLRQVQLRVENMGLPERMLHHHMDDPAEVIPYPPTFPIEIAMREMPVKKVCEHYRIDREEWDRIRTNPRFIADLKTAVESLKAEGESFRIKARLQAEQYLQKMWAMVQADYDTVPASVKADLIKFTVRAAGLDGSKDQAAAAGQTNNFKIVIDLG